MITCSISRRVLYQGLLSASAVLAGSSAFAGAFTYTPATTLEINFDDAPVGGQVTGFLGTDPSFNSTRNFYDTYRGETANWGSFGGAPDAITASVLPDLGPNGVGDGIARMTVSDTTPGGYFANFNFAVQGLRLVSDGGVDSKGFATPKLDTIYTVRAKTDVANAQFRINLDTGFGERFRDSLRVDIPELGLLLPSAGGLVQNIGSDVSSPAVDTWTFFGGSLSSLSAPGFFPFYGGGPNADVNTKIGITYPGGGVDGTLDVDFLRLTNPNPSDPSFLVYHFADFNTDEAVDADDIDQAFLALGLHIDNDNFPVQDSITGNRRSYFLDTYNITPADSVFDASDVDYLVQTVLGTNYGDVDLNGTIDTTDLGIAQANENNPGGWAMGDVNGDAVVDAADIAIIQAAIGSAIAGDYNNSGLVEQGDLDLVLLNWGTSGTPTGWVNEVPVGLVDQAELDGVLLNWGNTSEPAGSAVPEPATAALLGLGALAMLRRRVTH